MGKEIGIEIEEIGVVTIETRGVEIGMLKMMSTMIEEITGVKEGMVIAMRSIGETMTW